jgi:hypothetical protein
MWYTTNADIVVAIATCLSTRELIVLLRRQERRYQAGKAEMTEKGGVDCKYLTGPQGFRI